MGNFEMYKMVKKFFYLLIAILFLTGCGRSGYLLTGNITEESVVSQRGILSNILEDAEYALLIGSDGTAVFLSENSFPEITIHKESGKWNCSTDILPPVCNIRNLKEICIFKSFFGKKIQVENEDLHPFAVRMRDFEFLGESQKNGHTVRKYREIK
jgi:hypothetical protein